jgi:hypothetical protein
LGTSCSGSPLGRNLVNMQKVAITR